MILASADMVSLAPAVQMEARGGGEGPCLPTSAASSTHEKTWEDQRVAAAMI